MQCTEYMTRPLYPLEGGAPSKDWPGKFGWENCFVGSPGANESIQLNAEPSYVLNYLKPDYLGGNFMTQPTIQKVQFDSPWNEVVSSDSPHVVPIVRIPVTSSSYMYDEECNGLHAAGYRQAIDLLVQYLTSNGVAVIIDQHGCCAQGGKLDCKGDGRMAQAMYGNMTGAGGFWAMVASMYSNNPMVLFE